MTLWREEKRGRKKDNNQKNIGNSPLSTPLLCLLYLTVLLVQKFMNHVMAFSFLLFHSLIIMLMIEK